jgi:cyclic-di-AMP phosphodiesterase PgpH
MWNGLKTLKLKFPFENIYIILVIGAILIITFLSFSPYIPYSVSLNVGDVASATISSPRYLEFESKEDKLKTENLRLQRAELVEKVYSIDENINKTVIADIVNLFTVIKKYRTDLQKEETVLRPKALKKFRLNEINFILNLNDNEFAYIEYVILQNTEKILAQKINKIDLGKIRNILRKNLEILNLTNLEESFIFKVIFQNLKPNVVYDEAKTNERIRQEISAIKSFTTTIKKGQPLIYEGEKVTLENIDALKALNIYGLKANIFKFFGIFLVGLVSFFFLEKYIYLYKPAIYNNKKYFFLIYVSFLIVIGLAKLLQSIHLDNLEANLAYFVPITIATLLISLLISANVSIICGIIISSFIVMMFNFDLPLFFYLLFSSFVASFSTYRSYKRNELIKSGYIIGLGNIGFIVLTGLLKEINVLSWYSYNMIIGFGSGVISSMITLAIIPYFESIFQITTPQKLLEYSDLKHPLLKRLMITAPGTHQHSMMVANLAEAAAEAINANIVLARIGSYFHDIGKIKRPLFFTENQFSEENPHNLLNPRMSKLIITSHTKDGLILANQYKLPKLIKDIIIEHHGSSLVSFFFNQALKDENENKKNLETLKEEFRYPGPKPKTKEAGIIMLADAVEAAIRSVAKPSPAKILTSIEDIFLTKINDNQLDDCPLSLEEIKIIKETFLSVFKGIYHMRVDYQQEEPQNLTAK